MQFAGKDFLKMQAPPGYKPGVGRGAIGFSTERPAPAQPFPDTRNHGNKRKPLASDSDRFVNADEEEAARIFDDIEARRRKKKRTNQQQRQLLGEITEEKKEDDPEKSELASISIDEWSRLPDATDTLQWNKRLRETERESRRMYLNTSSTSTAGTDDELFTTDETENVRALLETMIKNQPLNESGYLQLIELEEKAMRLQRAREIAAKGTAKLRRCEKLWLKRLDLYPKSAEARDIADQACSVIRRSEKLWLRAIDLEPTRAAQLRKTEAALRECSTAELWLRCASLEEDDDSRLIVLEEAKELIKDPRIFVELARCASRCSSHCPDQDEILEEARYECAESPEVWLESLKLHPSLTAADPSLIVGAARHLGRPQLFELIVNLEDQPEIVDRLFKVIDLSEDEVCKLPKSLQQLAFKYLKPTEDIYLHISAESPEVLEEAVKRFPNSEQLWIRFYERLADSNDEKWKQMLDSVTEATPVSLLTALAAEIKKVDLPRYVEWLEPIKLRSPELLLAYLDVTNTDSSDLVEQGLKLWPECAELHLLNAQSKPNEVAAKLLRNALEVTSGESQASIWNRLASLEPEIPRRRALISQALAKHPGSGQLWLSRVKLEKGEGKPIAHALAEGLKRCPTYPQLWLEELLATDPRQRKRRLAEALRSTNGNRDVLVYGAQYFASTNNMETARSWLKRAKQPESVLTPNPFK